MTKHDPIPARLAALKGMTTLDLKAQWRELFDAEPPLYNRKFLESRLAYRIQEWAGPRLSNATKRELERIARAIEKDRGHQPKPTRQLKAGTKLLREWNGVVHEVQVLDDGAGSPASRPSPRKSRGPTGRAPGSSA